MEELFIKKIIKVFCITIIMTMVFSTNVLAAGTLNGSEVSEVQNSAQVSEFNQTFSFFTSGPWDSIVEMKVTVRFYAMYDYVSGMWSDLYCSSIRFVSATVNGQRVYIYLTCDEWGLDYGAELA